MRAGVDWAGSIAYLEIRCNSHSAKNIVAAESQLSPGLLFEQINRDSNEDFISATQCGIESTLQSSSFSSKLVIAASEVAVSRRLSFNK